LAALVLGIVTITAACGGPSSSPSGGPAATPGGALPTTSPPPVDVSGVPSAVKIEAASGTAAWIVPPVC
jgi:hypothetical protein